MTENRTDIFFSVSCVFLTIESREMKLPKKDVICYYFRFELMNIPHTFTVN